MFLARRRTTSSVTAWIEAARSISRCVRRSSGLRAGPPKSASNLAFVIVRPVQYSKYSRFSRKLPSSLRSMRWSRMRRA